MIDVATLQRTLNYLGFKLIVRGIMDDDTIKAIKTYQSQHGLKRDGIVGPITGTFIAKQLNPNGIPVALAVVLDCTNWDMPQGGWHMSRNVKKYRFFYQPSFPGGGYGSSLPNNELLNCGHVYVPVDLHVLNYVRGEAINIRNSDPKGDYFALLIRGLTFGVDNLSPLEEIESIFKKLSMRTQIVSEGLFAHELQSANANIAYIEASKGAKIILVGHSMGGDEIVPIAQDLSRKYIVNV
jgi:hypothetical protein